MFKYGQPHLYMVYMSISYQCAKYLLDTFVKMSLIKNNDIYIFTHLSAISVTRELRSISRLKYLHTLADPKTKKNNGRCVIRWATFIPEMQLPSRLDQCLLICGHINIEPFI